jgi:hypothetical protein
VVINACRHHIAMAILVETKAFRRRPQLRSPIAQPRVNVSGYDAPALLKCFYITLGDAPWVLATRQLEGMRKHHPVPAPAPYCLGSDF